MKAILFTVAFSLFILSCETERTALNTIPEDNLVANIVLKNKLLQVLQNPTAIDDLIDGSACFAIKFPYTVIANGQPVAVSSAQDFNQVQSILNANGGNNDVVTIQFPVSVTYADYTEDTFATQSEFDAAVTNCNSSAELSCMDFRYPVGVNTYRSNYQIAESFDIATKKALYEFLNKLNDYDAVAFAYPTVFNTPDGNVIAESSEVLEAQIDIHTQECLNALNPSQVVLEDAIVQGTWYVSYFFEISNQTQDYQNYSFAFLGSGTITVLNDDSGGSWTVIENTGTTGFTLTFTDSQLSALAQTWTVTALSQNQLQLYQPGTGVQPERYLTLSKI